MKSPTIPVIPTVTHWFVNEKSEKTKEVPTESDKSTKEPRTHAGKVILDIVRMEWIGLHVRHTLD